MNHQTRVIAARWVLPIASDPIQGGWVRMQDDCVVDIGRGVAPAGAEDLGDAALLPGLVNSHTHLEFSDLTQSIGCPGISLTDWIGRVVGARQGTTAESKAMAIASGVRELIDSGTRLVGEITTPPSHYPKQVAELEIVSFAEVLGLDPIRAVERFDAGTSFGNHHPQSGLSPHAPYSTTLQSVDLCVEHAVTHNRPLAMHVAESPDERELITCGTGPFASALQSMGVWREGVFPWCDQPFAVLIDRLAAAPRSLLIHGNYLNDREIEQLGKHPNMTVVYCPRTHHFFQHAKHPVDRMLAAGVRVALGTDSRASNPDLNVWHEVQFLWEHRPDIQPIEVLKMVTIHGAEGLGRRQLGRIKVGCQPGLGYVRAKATNVNDLFEDFRVNEYVKLSLR